MPKKITCYDSLSGKRYEYETCTVAEMIEALRKFPPDYAMSADRGNEIIPVSVSDDPELGLQQDDDRGRVWLNLDVIPPKEAR